MSDHEKLFPSPPIVRDRLARNIRERRLLRALLRLSIRAAEEQPPRADRETRPEAAGRGVAQ
jgi:hypothetical protein